jgi:membrane protease subunit (stomatin/prohibitin family)
LLVVLAAGCLLSSGCATPRVTTQPSALRQEGLRAESRARDDFQKRNWAAAARGFERSPGTHLVDGIMDQLRSFVVQKFADFLAESRISITEVASQYNEIAAALAAKIGPEFLDYGLTLAKFVIENITVPEEVEKALDERSKIGVLGDLDAYTKMKTAEAMGEAAKNPGGAAGAGVGLGAGMAMAQQMMQQQSKPSPAVSPSEQTGIICSSCNQLSPPAKFCRHCGQPITRANQCKACRTEIPVGSKFCSSCGAKVL